MNKQQFLKAFSDSMIRSTLALAYDVLEYGVVPYGGTAKMAISTHMPFKNDSTVTVESWSRLVYGPNDIPGDYSAGGKITWETTSCHTVVFLFSQFDAVNGNSWLELNRVTIGSDESKCFYPGIVSACESAGIPVEIEK